MLVAEGVPKVFAEQIRGRQLGLFRHGGARAVVCPAKQDIITGGVHSRRDTSSDLLPKRFPVSLLETNKEAPHDPRKPFTPIVTTMEWNGVILSFVWILRLAINFLRKKLIVSCVKMRSVTIDFRINFLSKL